MCKSLKRKYERERENVVLWYIHTHNMQIQACTATYKWRNDFSPDPVLRSVSTQYSTGVLCLGLCLPFASIAVRKIKFVIIAKIIFQHSYSTFESTVKTCVPLEMHTHTHTQNFKSCLQVHRDLLVWPFLTALIHFSLLVRVSPALCARLLCDVPKQNEKSWCFYNFKY